MNKTTLLTSAVALAVAGGALLGGAVAHASDTNTQTYSDGTNNANVQVNGTLGADNTSPSASIPELSSNWVNVTLDTATIFYNTSTDNAIKSPTYNITNNSGRPMNVSVQGFTQTDSSDISNIADLDVTMHGKRPSLMGPGSYDVKTNLISNGKITASSAPSFELANSQNSYSYPVTAPANANTGTFDFSGSVTNKATKQTQPSFSMNLLFTPETIQKSL